MIIPDSINGVDISSVQGDVDFKKLREAGFEYVYIQSSRYSRTPESRFLRYKDQAVLAGLVVGAYHFCSHDTDPVKQAEFFYRSSGGLGSGSGELPPMADWEYCTPSHYPNHPQHCVEWIEKFAETCDELWYPERHLYVTPRLTVAYTYPNYAATHQPALSESRLGERPLCYASYKSGPYVPRSVAEVPFHAVPKPWTKPLVVQYSGDKGAKVPGIMGACDRQVFTGTREEWNVFIGLARGSQAQEEPPGRQSPHQTRCLPP